MSDDQNLNRIFDKLDELGKVQACIDKKVGVLTERMTTHIEWGEKREAEITAKVDAHDLTIRRVRDFGALLHVLWFSLLAYFGYQNK